jgi:hypothetical protein
MWKLLAVLVLAGCPGMIPGTIDNPTLRLADLPAQEIQLVYQAPSRARVVDLQRHVVFDLGPPGFAIDDISDDGSIVALRDPSFATMVIVRNGVDVAHLKMPCPLGFVAIAPTRDRIAATCDERDGVPTDELVIVELHDFSIHRVPAQRRGRDLDEPRWTLDGTAIALLLRDDPALAIRWIDPSATPRTVTPDQLFESHWLAEQHRYGRGPLACTKSDGTVVTASYQDFADIRGMVLHPHFSGPIYVEMLLPPDCRTFAMVHDFKLWLFTTDRHAVELGKVDLDGPRIPVAYHGAPFGRR